MKVFVSHDHEDTKRCAPLLRTLDAWGVDYFFDYAEDLFGQQLSDRVQAELAQSQVLIRVCTRATPRSYWMSIESGAFMGLLADEHRAGPGRSERRIVSLILDPAYQREPFDASSTVVDATDTEHPQWVNTFRAALGLPPLQDLAEVARAIYVPPPPARMSRRTAIGLGAAGIVALGAVSAGGLLLYERGKTTTTTSVPLRPPTDDPALKWPFFAGDRSNLNGTSISAAPVLDNGTLYIATRQGILFALRAEDGHISWRYSPPHPLPVIFREPLVAQGVAYLCVHDMGVFAVSALDGAQVWELDLDYVFPSSKPVLANGLLYVNTIGAGLGPDVIGVLDLKGKHVLSLDPTEQTYGASAPLVAGGVVYVGGTDGYMYALDATKFGPELWRTETGAAKAQQLKQPNAFYVTATPAIADGVVYVGSGDNSVYALDARSGAKLWSFVTNGPINASSPVIASGVLYIGSTDKNLYALDARSGKLIWSYATDGEINGTPTLANGVVYAGSYDEYVHAVDATSGKLIRKYHAGRKVFAQPVVADGVLYAATSNGWVLAFRLS